MSASRSQTQALGETRSKSSHAAALKRFKRCGQTNCLQSSFDDQHVVATFPFYSMGSLNSKEKPLFYHYVIKGLVLIWKYNESDICLQKPNNSINAIKSEKGIKIVVTVYVESPQKNLQARLWHPWVSWSRLLGTRSIYKRQLYFCKLAKNNWKLKLKTAIWHVTASKNINI